MFIPRTLAELEAVPRNTALGRALITVAVVTAALFLVLSANITLGQEDLAVGEVAPRDIRAPREATFVSASLTEEAREAASDQVDPILTRIKVPADNRDDQLAQLDALGRRVSIALDRRDSGAYDADEVLEVLAGEDAISFGDRSVIAGLSAAQWDAIVAAAATALDTTLQGQVDAGELGMIRDQVRELITADLGDGPRAVAGNVAAALVEPSHVVDLALTEEARDRAREAVPPVDVTVRQGEIIASDGQVITVAQMEALDEFGLTQPAVDVGTVIGNLLVAALVASMLVAYLWRFEPVVWHRNRSVLLFFLGLVATAVAMRIAADRTLWAFIVPTTATVLLMGILLQSGAGAVMAGALAVLAGVMNRDALDLAVFVLAGGLAALLAVTRAERLNAFVRVFFVLSVVNLAAALAFSLLDQRDLAALAQLTGASVLNAILSVLLAVGSFAVLGNLFGIMTVFQLLELANPSNRLLRRLLLETPGTYHHSVMVGNLAERAAETIGADPLLARVAAYYHDIGKMKNPLAFIENQGGAHNIHDDLNAETSARIIAGHIRDGIDLGYEHGLPVQIIGFIPQHHGTSVMSFFHGKALREVGGRDEAIDEQTFRYPGPKPQSREAAIIMLADGVEASVRSLDEKDEESIRAMVDRIVDARVEDGQLDDADLTLKNIAQIKDAFVGQLLGMYHTRIKYPDNVVPMEQRREA
jgi:putative nucleotidyltransferase with HDIG domain